MIVYPCGMKMLEETYQSGQSLIRRVKTGIEGLDNLLEGGIPKNSITLVSGSPGAGKSILCFQFMYQGIKDGEKILYLTLDKKEKGVLLQAKKLGFNFQPAIEQGQATFRYLNINKKLVYEAMGDEILSNEYKRIVLDSITPLAEMPLYLSNTQHENRAGYSFIDSDKESSQYTSPSQRKHILYIMNALETSEATSIVTSELSVGSSNLSRDGISEYLADGVILLKADPTMDRRKLSIFKMRNTNHTLKPQDIQITEHGILFTKNIP
jgi:KaiC/GvpD/RAD55 family RecA-like ATPase